VEHVKDFVTVWEPIPVANRPFVEGNIAVEQKLESSTFVNLSFREQRRIIIDELPTADLMKFVSRIVDLLLPKIRFRWDWNPVVQDLKKDECADQLFCQACPIGSDLRIVKILKHHFIDTFVAAFSKMPNRDVDRGQTTLRDGLLQDFVRRISGDSFVLGSSLTVAVV